MKILILLIITLLSLNSLHSIDKITNSKIIELGNRAQIYDIAFLNNKVLILSKYYKIIEGDAFYSTFFKIQEFDYNFNLIDEFEIDNISIDEKKYQYLPFKMEISNDTLGIIGHFIEQGQDVLKYGHNLFVLKYFENKEVYRNFDFINDGFAPSTYLGNYDNLNFTKDEENIYIAFKGPEIVVRKYDKFGNYLKTFTLIDDSISTNIEGKVGSKSVNSIHKVKDKIFLFLSELTNVKFKDKNIVNIYDENFNLIEEKEYTENKSNIEVKSFDINGKHLLVFGELLSSPRFANRPSWYLYEYDNESINYTGYNLGLNYPDYIHDIQKIGNDYIVVGAHDKIPAKPFQVSLIQKLDSNFAPIKSFTFYDEDTDKSNFALKVKVLSEEEYIVVGALQIDNSYYFAKFNTILSVEKNENEKYTIFPNPSSDFIQVEGVNSTDKYEIRDLLGNIVGEGIYNSSIDISYLSTAYYFLKINNQTIKFIKK